MSSENMSALLAAGCPLLHPGAPGTLMAWPLASLGLAQHAPAAACSARIIIIPGFLAAAAGV